VELKRLQAAAAAAASQATTTSTQLLLASIAQLANVVLIGYTSAGR